METATDTVAARLPSVEPALDTRTVLAPFSRHVLLATGRAAYVHPAAERDVERIACFYERLGERSTYLRFFGMRPRIDIYVRQAADQDVRRHVTLLAELDGELIGVGDYHVLPGGEDAEVAFAVADDHHGEGIATVLLEDLALIAGAAGCSRLVADVLADNRAMRDVFRAVGLVCREWFDAGVGHVELDLGADNLSPRRRRATRLAGRGAVAAAAHRSRTRRRDRRG